MTLKYLNVYSDQHTSFNSCKDVLVETVNGIEILLGIKQVTSTTESWLISFQKSKLKAGFSHTILNCFEMTVHTIMIIIKRPLLRDFSLEGHVKQQNKIRNKRVNNNDA